MPFNLDRSIAFTSQSGDAVARAARTVTGDSGWLDIGAAKEVVLQLHADGGTGTTPTLDVKLQTSYNGTDTTAIDVTTGAFTQVTTVASGQIKTLTAVHRYVKVVWTIGGGGPSFNFGVYLTAR